VGLRYRFGAGWKFVRIEPKDAAARKIEGEPRAFGIWVHGDGQGGTPCIRLRDATGQTHQVRGEAITWKGWRYLTFPLRPAPDDGQTPSLPDARPHSDRFRCGGRESEFLAETISREALHPLHSCLPPSRVPASVPAWLRHPTCSLQRLSR
jgi:hypothetical protein